MNQETKLKLKKMAHHLKPVILIGQKGMSEAVIAETDHALKAHECIKVKISGWEKDDRHQMIQQLCNELHADFIDTIGHTSIIFRKNNEQKPSRNTKR